MNVPAFSTTSFPSAVTANAWNEIGTRSASVPAVVSGSYAISRCVVSLAAAGVVHVTSGTAMSYRLSVSFGAGNAASYVFVSDFRTHPQPVWSLIAVASAAVTVSASCAFASVSPAEHGIRMSAEFAGSLFSTRL